MTEHLTDLEIADYIDDPELCARAAEIEAHLAQCATCREAVETAQRFEATIDAELMADLIAARQPAVLPPGLLSLAEHIDDEEREASNYLRGIVMIPRAFKWAAISEKPELYTAGVVRVLCAAALKLRERSPKHSLTVADEAASIAEMLSPQRYDETTRAEARAEAQLERANALRYLGRFEEALEALDTCEAAYRSVPLAERPLAIVNYVRSVIYMKSERLDEAMQLASESMRIFRSYGDQPRAAHAQMVIGGCLFYRREYALARDLYRHLIPVARAINEPATEALCLMNLAHAECELGEFAISLLHYSDAVDRYEQLGLRTEVLRARWGAADLVALMGNLTSAIAQLRETAAAMLDLGLVNDHALVILDAVSKLFAIGNLSELPGICAKLVQVFAVAKMPENARTAMAYLEAVVRTGALTKPVIDGVTEYIEREDYAEAFVPPPA